MFSFLCHKLLCLLSPAHQHLNFPEPLSFNKNHFLYSPSPDTIASINSLYSPISSHCNHFLNLTYLKKIVQGEVHFSLTKNMPLTKHLNKPKGHFSALQFLDFYVVHDTVECFVLLETLFCCLVGHCCVAFACLLNCFCLNPMSTPLKSLWVTLLSLMPGGQGMPG